MGSVYETVCFVESANKDKVGTTREGLPVVSVDGLSELYKIRKVEKIVISGDYHKKTCEDMIHLSKDVGIVDDDICIVSNTVLRTGKINAYDRFAPYRKLRQIYKLHIHLTDRCNMNCELCCHSCQFTPETDTKTDISPEEFERDFRQLSELVPDICFLEMGGGEPFLNDNIIRMPEIARRYYPYSDIRFVTNGTLIMNIDDVLWKTMRDNNMGINLSLYPPMHDRYDELLCLFQEKGIRFYIIRVDRFFKKFTDRPIFDAGEMSNLCGYCMGVRHGKLCRCIDALTINYLNEALETSIGYPDTISIYDEHTPEDVLSFLEKPIETCRYCANRQTTERTFP